MPKAPTPRAPRDPGGPYSLRFRHFSVGGEKTPYPAAAPVPPGSNPRDLEYCDAAYFPPFHGRPPPMPGRWRSYQLRLQAWEREENERKWRTDNPHRPPFMGFRRDGWSGESKIANLSGPKTSSKMAVRSTTDAISPQTGPEGDADDLKKVELQAGSKERTNHKPQYDNTDQQLTRKGQDINQQLQSSFFGKLNFDVRAAIYEKLNLPPFTTGKEYQGLVSSYCLAYNETSQSSARKLLKSMHGVEHQFKTTTSFKCKINEIPLFYGFKGLKKITVLLPLAAIARYSTVVHLRPLFELRFDSVVLLFRRSEDNEALPAELEE